MTLAVRSRSLALALLVAAAGPVGSADAQENTRYLGRTLSEALQLLQAEGVPVVFSSAVVSPDLRVAAEPRARAPRQRLDELLVPHGLETRSGPGGTLQVVRAASPGKPRRSAAFTAIAGRIVDASTNAGLARAVVRLDVHRLEASTNANGEFRFDHVPVGTRILSVRANGYLPAEHVLAVDGQALATVTLALSSEPQRHTEFVSVIDEVPTRIDHGVGSEMSLERNDLAGSFGSVSEDPVRAVHALPRVVVPDDLRSEFTVRGSPFRHVALVIDGVSTDWLLHSLPRQSSGSLSMLSSQVLERATLRTGAYPRRNGDALAAELELTLRDGSRRSRRLQGGIGGGHALFVGEGPLGRVDHAGLARGSWLLAARQSVREWPPERSGSSRTPFGFVDGLARMVLDVGQTQQFGFTALGGVTSADADEEDAPVTIEPAAGARRSSMVAASWRATFAPTVVFRQQVSWAEQRASDPDVDDQMGQRETKRALSYRANLTRATRVGALEAGVQITHQNARLTALDTPALHAGAWRRSGFVHFAWAATPSLTISPGTRVTWSTLTSNPATSYWLLSEWSPDSNWTVTASAGVSGQPSDLVHVVGASESFALRPERAAHAELGLERRVTSTLRWQATLFGRREDDVLRGPEVYPRLVDGTLVYPRQERTVNGLQGTAGGIELLIERQHPVGLSGRAAYSYGRSRQSDPTRGGSYWSDFDQRHTFTASAAFRREKGFHLAATFRAGSNIPVPAYLIEHSGRLIVSDRRNQVRLPWYARLDVRADRSLHYFGRRWTLFAEALNALDRANVGLGIGSVDPLTGVARGFTERLLNRRVSAGVLVDF